MPGNYDPLNLIFGDILTAARAAHLETQYKLAKERGRALGGIPDVGVTSTSWIDVPGVIVVRLDEDARVRVHAMGFVSGGTGYLRLWDIDGAQVVTSSEISFTETSPTLQETPDLELVAGDFKLQVRVSVGTEHAIAYGAALVTQ